MRLVRPNPQRSSFINWTMLTRSSINLTRRLACFRLCVHTRLSKVSTEFSRLSTKASTIQTGLWCHWVIHGQLGLNSALCLWTVWVMKPSAFCLNVSVAVKVVWNGQKERVAQVKDWEELSQGGSPSQSPQEAERAETHTHRSPHRKCRTEPGPPKTARVFPSNVSCVCSLGAFFSHIETSFICFCTVSPFFESTGVTAVMYDVLFFSRETKLAHWFFFPYLWFVPLSWGHIVVCLTLVMVVLGWWNITQGRKEHTLLCLFSFWFPYWPH